MLAANPLASLSVPGNVLIGDTLNFSVGFTNSSATTTGYGPYVDLVLPKTGDGGISAPDGISFNSATYLSASLTSTVLTFDAFGHATHPYAKTNTGAAVVVNGTPGDQLVVLQLPFGSFTPGQPTANINVSATVSNYADVGIAQSITVRGGFEYGNDALDNPKTDPSIIGSTATGSVTPELFIVTKQYIGPEDETATGPNFPRQDLISVEVAPGQTITNLDVTDILPSNMQYVQVDATTIRGTTTSTTSQSTPSASIPGGTLTRRFASVTGTSAANDATLLYTYYIPLNDAASNPIIDPNTGGATTSSDSASAKGNWTPLNPADSSVTGITSNTASHILNDRSIATQKSVAVVNDTGAAGPSPGDTLQYSINFEVSDFFAFANLLLTDIISDGQHFDPSFTPTFLVNGNLFALSTANFNAANYSVVGNYTGATPTPTNPDGTSTVAFQISNELISRGQDGTLLGGMVTPGGGALLTAPGDGPTTGTIIFRTIIQNKFTDTFPSGEANVDHGDKLTDNVTVQGDILSTTTLAPTGSTVTDASSASVTIVTGTLTKSIYAVNGSTSLTTPVKIAAGDTVTYRIQYTLPLSDEEQLAISDYLPLPIFFSSTVGSFDDVGYSGSGSVIPASGHANFGPNDTFRSLSNAVPTLTSNATSNSLKFAYPDYKDPANSSSTIDLLFTVTASNLPFADGLFLTNQAHSIEGTTNSTPTSQDAIVQLQMTEPVLNITKGVVATDNTNAVISGTVGPVNFSAPGSAGYRGSATINSNGLVAHPVSAGVSKIDAGDLVTFAIIVENTGSGLHGAFDVRLNDVLPTAFAIPSGGLNLNATDGTGAVMTLTDLGGGLFGSGLGVSDPGPTANPDGALDPYDSTSGRNILVLTYDLQATAAVTPKGNLSNTATLYNYASQSGGADFLTTPLTATAPVTTADVAVSKSLTSTDQGFTSGSNLAIGEIATYSVTMTVPEGTTPAAKLIDALPAGMALYSLDTLTASSGALSFGNGTLSNILAAATIGIGGSSISLDFGSITDTDSDNSVAETITFVYRAIAINVATNTNNATLTNTAAFDYTGGTATATAQANVAIPTLKVDKTIDNPQAQAGDTVTYTLVISHTAESRADAFDLSLSDVIPSDLTYVPAFLNWIGGISPDTLTLTGSTISASYSTFTKTDTTTITFQAVVGGGVAGLKPVTNTADLKFTTLPGSPGQISAFNTNSYERTGNASDPGGAVNNLDVQGSATFTPPLSVSKTILGTNQSFTSGNNVGIGEQVQYQVSMVISQGTTPGATLVDTLPSGLAILSLDSITTSASLSTSIGGGFAGVLSNATVGSNGSSTSFNFGTVTNTDTDSSTVETVVVTYTVVVLNTASNQSGVQLTNSATFTVPDGSSTASAPSVTVVSPALQVVETPSSTTGDAGGSPITFTVIVSHTGASTADAFDVNLADLVPSGFNPVASSFTNTAGTVPTSLSQSGSNLSASFTTFALGATSTFTFQATLNATTVPGQDVTDNPAIAYTSLPGSVTTPESTYNTVSTERTGNTSDPGGSANTFTATTTASVTVNVNSVSGFVYSDTNIDGTKQGSETGHSGVTVNLGGVDNLGNVVTLTTTTSGTGAYQFNDLRPGTYTVSEIQPSAYLDGKDELGTPFGGSTSTNDVFSSLVIPLGTNAAGANYNYGELSPASVSVTVFRDGNNDGIQNGSDSGISGASITLSGTDDLGNSINTTATTNGSGNVSFNNLRPGTYTLVETQPNGYHDGKDSAGATGGTLTNDQVGNFTISAGQSATGVTFGELSPSSLAGEVYHDANNDGTKQAGESGIDGVLMTLTGMDDLGNTVNTVTTTSGGGLYSFENLRPSNGVGYTITETQPTGFLDGKDTVGSPGGVATVNDVFSEIVLNPGTNGANNNFGELIPASLSGFVYEDINNDGTKQSGDTGISAVTITLIGTDDVGGTVNQVVTTSGAGAYTFTGLRPGTYSITETQPNIYVDGKDTAGTPGGSTATKNTITGITLGSAVSGTNNNFGEEVTADLSITKTINDATPNAGENITYTVTIHNAGPDNATNVAVSDLLPSGLTFVSSTATQGSYANGSGLWTVGLLPNGATQTLSITANVTSPSPITNIATIVATDQADLTKSDWTASASETPRLSDLGVAQSVSAPTPNVGAVIQFTTVLTNYGPDTGTGIAVSIPIPVGLSFISGSPGQGGFNSATGLWTVGTLTSGASVVLVVSLRVDDPNPKTDTATITAADQYDTVSANNTSAATETPRLSDLSLTKVASNPTPNVGDTITFTVTLTNNGPDDAHGISVHDLVPSTLQLNSITPNQGTYDSNTGLWTIATVSNGASVVVVFDAKVISADPVTNTASIVSSDTYDPNTTNNTTSATETPQQADLAVTTTVNDPHPNLGDLITFTIQIQNNGKDTATNVALNDALPTGLSFVSSNISQGSFDSSSGIWSVGSLSISGTATLTITALVTSPSGQTNLATISHSDQYDPVLANNMSSATEIPQVADLAVTKTVDNTAPNVGDVITFTIAIVNNGPDVGTHVALSDPLPTGLTFLSASPSQGSYDSDTGLWSVGSVSTNVTLTITARVASPNPLTNSASLTHSDQYDPVTENNNGSVTETPQIADLSLTKTVDKASPKLGGHVTFTLTLTNYGPDSATNVVVSDLLPPGLTYVSAVSSQGTYDFSSGIWTVGALSNLGTSTLTIVTTVSGIGIKTNLAQVSASDQYDPNSTPNNSSPTENDQASVDVTPLSSIAGSVFLDTNNDGIRQNAETGISGVSLTLSGIDDHTQTVNLTTVTISDGSYLFDNLRPGTYSITEDQPTAYSDGIDSLGTAGGTLGNDVVSVISLGAGVVSDGYIFGERGASLSGTVFIDTDQNAALNSGEPGFPGVTVTLKDGNGNVLGTAVTGSDGSYSFDNLPAGLYALVSTSPTGYGQSTPIILHPSLPLVGLSGQNFGETTASLAGSVYVDANNDGVFQGTESGFVGSMVTLSGTDALGDPVSRAATTLADGSYTFTDLLSGTYSLTLTPPSGYIDGKRTIGTPGGHTAAEAFTGIELAGGVLGISNNFGELVPASLSGFVYLDANDDGVKQSHETPTAGVVLTLSGIHDQGQPITATTTTAADGSYAFNNLRPGEYVVTITHPSGVLAGKNTPGSQTGVAGLSDLTDLVLVSGTEGINNNFALLDPATFSGSVYFDNNNDGVRQSGEAGLPGVTITLSGTDDNSQTIHQVVSTGSDGSYLFINLRPGLYTVTETQPGGYVDGKDAVGSAGGTPGDDVISSIALMTGQNASAYTFGEQGSTLSGVVTVDKRPVSSAIVRLIDSSGNVIATTTTGPDGTYQIKNLPSGAFTVAFDAVMPDGTHSTASRPVTLSPGAVADESLHLNLTDGSLSGTIYLEHENYGVRDPNEYGVAHVTVTLSGVDNQGKPISRTTVTDVNGTYSFTNLPTGVYSISAGGPRTFINGIGHPGTLGGSSSKDTISKISLQSGENGTGFDFGKLARPECRLLCVQFHAALRQGPLQNGTHTPVSRKGSMYKPIPVIRYWLPTLAERFGFTPGGVPGVRASAHAKAYAVITSAVKSLVTKGVRLR